MELDVSKGFMHPGTPYPFEAEVQLAPQDVGGEEVSFGPARLEGTYFVADDTVRLEGTLAVTARAACARCMEPAERMVKTAFDETFRKDAQETVDESFRYEGKAVPLDHMALTLTMLELPMRFTCGRPDCRPAAELKPWDEDEKIWAEQPDEGGTYRPFEALGEMLGEQGQEH